MFTSLSKLLISLLNLPLALLSIGSIVMAVLLLWYPAVLYWSGSYYAPIVGAWLLAGGIFLLLLALLGLIGAMRRSTRLMVFYSVVLGLLCTASITVLVIFTVDRTLITASFQESLSTELRTNFDDPDNPDRQGNSSGISPRTQDILRLFRLYPCCGAKNFSDFLQSSLWHRNYSYTDSNNLNGPYKVVGAAIPVICCRNTYTFQGDAGLYHVPNDKLCLANPSSDNSYTKNCVDYWLDMYQTTVSFASMGVNLAFLLVFVCSVGLACAYGRRDKRFKAVQHATGLKSPSIALSVSRTSKHGTKPFYLVAVNN